MSACRRCGSTSLYQSGKCRRCARAKMGRRPLRERAMSRIAVDPETGCWVWLGHVTNWGYARLRDQDVYVFLHRYFYELVHNNGQRLPPSIHVHHECGEKRCCNPQHLRALSMREHSLHHQSIDKAIAASAVLHRAQTHCKRGHEFTPENTWVDRRGSRCCRHCNRLRQRGEYGRRKRRRASAEELAKPQEARGH